MSERVRCSRASRIIWHSITPVPWGRLSMRPIYLLAGCVSALTAISGCANGRVIGFGEDAYVVTSATPDSITLRFREGDLNKATGRAQAHCQETHRSAEMVNVMPADGYSMGTFRCA